MNHFLDNSKTVSLDSSIPDYPVLIVENSAGTAKVALHGAHLFEWKPTGADAVIYTSPDAIYKEGKAIRGGIPICWPWFNAHPTDSSKPSHGIGRNRFWELSGLQESDTETILTLSLVSDDVTKKLWPYDFRAEVSIHIGQTLKVELTTVNTDRQPLQIGGALHSYFCVNRISDTSISGLDSTSYLDTVGEETVRTQNGEITFSGEVDRIYTDHSGDIFIKDKVRTLKISRSGSRSAVIWNPWIEKAKGLGDLPDNAYHDFVCVEAANAREDVYLLKPGESHTLSTSVEVV